MSLYGGLAENTRRNERLERGSATFTGNTVITVASPMRIVTQVWAQLINNASPGVGPSVITIGNIGSGGNNANQFTIFAWMVTSSANTTLIAATSAATVQWFALGTLAVGF